MDIEKLIEDLQWWAEHCDRTNYGCATRSILQNAATALSTLQAENTQLRAELELKHNQQTTIAEVTAACALAELRAYKEIGSLDYFKRLAEMDKAEKYIQPAHLAAIRDMSRILATIGPALQGAPEEIENVLRLYDSEIKEARED